MQSFGKKLLATVLSVLIAVSACGMNLSFAAEDNNDIQYSDEPIETGSDTVSQYSPDDLATELLIPHTGKSSELEGCAALDLVKEAEQDYQNNFQTLTCDKQLYDDLGFDSDELSAQAEAYATDSNYQNPLAGYTCVDPNELLVGSVNRSDNHRAIVKTYNDSDAQKASDLPGIDSMTENTSELAWWENSDDWDFQTNNGIGVDVDGDGLDEMIYYSLCYKRKDPNKGSSIYVRLYDRVLSGDSYVWSLAHEYSTYMQSSDYVLDIIAAESKGYVALAAGDYDDDGKEELAYYMPDKGNSSDADDARVVIMNFDKDSSGNYTHHELSNLHIKDFTADYKQMGDDRYLPVVALSTTSIRLGENTSASAGAAQYKTHDDLVISVSVPRQYKNRDLYLNSMTKIFGFETGSAKQLFKNEYLPFDENSKRMAFVNSCDADLNGDGFKELVVAGLKEYNMTKPKGASDVNRNYGDWDGSHNYVNIITHNGTEYTMLWTDPMEVDAHGGLEIDHYTAKEPIPICAGHYIKGKLGAKDQVCIQGVVFDCDNTKISGAPVHTETAQDGTKTYYITDTQPGYDAANFPYAEVAFTQKHKVNTGNVGATWIDCSTSGHFFDGVDTDQIAVISSDPVDANDDNLYMDIIIMSCDASGDWEEKAYNDYLDKKNEDDDGTSLFVSFINAEEDTFYYRWAGSYASYTAPVLYSVIQVPPFYKEANSIYSTEFDITTGLANHSGLNLGLGFSASAMNKLQVGFPIILQGNVDFGGQFGLDFAYNHTWSFEREIKKSINISSDEDCVICYVAPIVVNAYEIVTTKDPNEQPVQFVEISNALDPVFTALTVDQYNTALRTSIDNYTEDSEALSPDVNAKMIDTEKLAKSCAGDPVMYDHTLKDATGKSHIKDTDPGQGMTSVDIDNSGSTSMKGAEISFADVDDNTGSVSVSQSLTAKIGLTANFLFFKDESELAFTLAGQIGYVGGRTNSNGVSMSTVYNSPARELLNGAVYSESDVDYSSVNSQIRHYDPLTGTMYNYKSTSVCFKMDNYAINRDGVDDGDDENMEMSPDEDVFALSFYTENYDLPPEPPENFAIRSMVKNSDGSADITLLWNSKNRNPERFADGYNIYLSDYNTNLKTVHLQNRDRMIEPNENSDYTTYTVHLEAGTYNDSMIFYIAPVKTEVKGDGVLIATEGALCDMIEIASVEENTNGNMRITKQPKTYGMSRDTNDETATFSICAKKNVTDTNEVAFHWQQFNEETDRWETVKGETAAASAEEETADIYRSEFSLPIPGSAKADYLDTGIRCVVECGNYSVISDIVTLRYADELPDKPAPYLLGDVDVDEDVSTVDVTWIQRDLAMMEIKGAFNEAAADVDEDGEITTVDATWIQRYLANMDAPEKINTWIK